jgi:cytochrome c-type biogenesis protein
VDVGLLTLALLAGAVAAVNPCGFAMLPAYLSLLVAQAPAGSGSAGAIVRAGRFAAGMTLGFVVVFGAFGAVVTPLALSLERYLPVLTVGMGGVLVLLGGWLLSGRELGVRGLGVRGLAGRGAGPTHRWSTQVTYGATFALASLSCTVGPFLAVTSTAVSDGRGWSLVASLLAYALGMGTVVLVLAIAAATSTASLTAAARRAGPLVSRLSGALLLAAGAYVAWYGWFEIRVLAGSTTSDPVVSAAIGVQEAVTRIVAGVSPSALAVVGGTLVALTVGLALVRHRDAARR